MANRSTALITGATGGLGKALCAEFIRQDFDLVITARSAERLQALVGSFRLREGQKITAIPADLNQEDGPKVLVDKIRGAGIAVDVLVNNAGFGLGGPFAHQKPRVQEAVLRVNVMAPTRLCRMLLPAMLRRGHGGILNVCSTGGFVAGPYNNIYCAGKAYLLHFTEALAEELADTPIQATALCPGAMDTGFAKRAGMESTPLFRYGVMEPGEAARAGFRALSQGQDLVVAGGLNRAVVALARLVPRKWAVRASGHIQRPRPEEREPDGANPV